MRGRWLLLLLWTLLGLAPTVAGAQATRSDNSTFPPNVGAVTPMGALFTTAPTALTDGSVGLPRMDANRNLQINCLNCGGAAGGTSALDLGGFTAGTSSFTPIGGARDDTAPSTLAEGQLGIARLTTNRAIHVNLRDAAGAELAVGGGTQYAEDTVHVSGDMLTLTGAVRNDAGTALAGDGDRTVLQVDSTGALRVTAVGGGGGVQYTQGTAATSTDTLTLAGAVRWDVPILDPGVAQGDRTGLSVDASGRLWIHVGAQTGALNVVQTGIWSQRLQDGNGNVVTSVAAGLTRPLDTVLRSAAGAIIDTFGGTAMVDDAAFTAGVTTVTPAAAVFNTVRDLVDDNDAGALAMTQRRALYISPETPAGVSMANETASAMRTMLVDNAGAFIAPSVVDAASRSIVVGAAVHDAPVLGAPLLVGVESKDFTGSPLTNAVDTTGEVVRLAASYSGVLYVMPVSEDGSSTASVQVSGAALASLQAIDDDQTGASVHYRTSSGTTEDEHEIKASAGRLFSITATNTNAAARYLRCYNLTAANTTPGSSTVLLGFAIPGNTAGAGATTNFGPSGIAFSTALTCTLTTGAADSDVAEVAADEIKIVYSYK